MISQVWRLTIYGEWEYQKQIQALNRLSETGLQMVEGGMFCSKFERDSKARYVYQMDYRPETENEYRYMEMFEEMGWKHLNRTRSGWHYFRKPYQENMPQEEMEIYTDEESVAELHGRLRKIYWENCLIVLFWPVYAWKVVCGSGWGVGWPTPWNLIADVLLVLGAGPLSIYSLLLLTGEWRYQNGKKPLPQPSKKVWIFHLCLIWGYFILNIFVNR